MFFENEKPGDIQCLWKGELQAIVWFEAGSDESLTSLGGISIQTETRRVGLKKLDALN